MKLVEFLPVVPWVYRPAVRAGEEPAVFLPLVACCGARLFLLGAVLRQVGDERGRDRDGVPALLRLGAGVDETAVLSLSFNVRGQTRPKLGQLEVPGHKGFQGLANIWTSHVAA